MGTRFVRRRLFARAFVVVLLVTSLSGCTEDAVDTEPYTRIKSITYGGPGRSDCPPLSSLQPFEWCMEAEYGFADFDCSPPQLAFAMDRTVAGIRAPSQKSEGQRITANTDAYVECQYAFTWTITARSLMPDSMFSSTASHAGSNETKTCKIGASGDCSIAGQIDGFFRFDGPDQKIDLRAILDAQMTGLSGQPIPLPGGQGSWEHHLGMKT